MVSSIDSFLPLKFEKEEQMKRNAKSCVRFCETLRLPSLKAAAAGGHSKDYDDG